MLCLTVKNQASTNSSVDSFELKRKCKDDLDFIQLVIWLISHDLISVKEFQENQKSYGR